MLALSSSTAMAYSPTVTRRGVSRAVAPHIAAEDMIGKSSVKDVVFSPLKLATKYDIKHQPNAGG